MVFEGFVFTLIIEYKVMYIAIVAFDTFIPSKVVDFKNSSKFIRDKMVMFRLREHKVITIEKDLMSD